jgi:hypothetical protein
MHVSVGSLPLLKVVIVLEVCLPVDGTVAEDAVVYVLFMHVGMMQWLFLAVL